MIKYFLFLLVSFSYAHADDCSPQSIEILKNDKTAIFLGCYKVQQKPETIAALQIFTQKNQGRIGLTLTAYTNAFNFNPKSTPYVVKTDLAQDLLAFNYNGNQINTAIYEDVDNDGQKELVFNGYVLPKILRFYIVAWDEKIHNFVFKSHSNFADEDVDFIVGANLPATKFSKPKLDVTMMKHTLLMPYETYDTDHASQTFKTYKLVGPIYVEDIK